MACYSPISASQLDGGEVVFFARKGMRVARELTLPCGQCIGCRVERSRQWGVRIMHEQQMHERSSFVTLTYSTDYLPRYGIRSLEYVHFQKFMKRLRRRVGNVRFFMCGEYGEAEWRPHFHACLFGVGFEDRYYWRKSRSGFDLYRSPLLESLWPYGHCEVGELSFQSAQYVAGYVTKKVTGPMASDHYSKVDFATGEVVELVPEFARMSLKPGIGASWFDTFRGEVYPFDRVVVNGAEAKPPRYYDKRLALIDPDGSDILSLSRYRKSFNTTIDSSVDRLRAREIVARARLSLFARDLE